MRPSLNWSWALVGGLCLGFGQAQALTINEAEQVGTATNNTLLTAEAIDNSAFTKPVPAEVFDPPGYATASIQGHGGGLIVNGQATGLPDVDFYSFTVAAAGHAMFDVDFGQFDSMLALFDHNGTLLAFNDDSGFDPGSNSVPYDAFIGVIALDPGTYYVAVTQFNNYPNSVGTSLVSGVLLRPDGANGGNYFNSATPGDSSFPSDGPDNGETYLLHLSFDPEGTTSAVPEPATAGLTALALASLLGLGLRRRAARR